MLIKVCACDNVGFGEESVFTTIYLLDLRGCLLVISDNKMPALPRYMLALAAYACHAQGMKVGVLYEGWHAFAVDAIQTIKNTTGGLVLTVEDVIRSNGTYSMYDMLDKYGLQPASDNFYYQAEPEAGFYCLYTHRANETGYIPDCLNVTGTLTRHANELTQAGVDFIAMDSTNLPVLDRESDVIQVRFSLDATFPRRIAALIELCAGPATRSGF
jgi:hypothetical protein